MTTNGSNFWEEQKVNYPIGTMEDAPTNPLTVRLYVGNPGENGTGGTDVTGFFTLAPTVTFDAPSQSGNVYEIANTAAVDFGTAVDDLPGDLSHFAVWTDLSGLGQVMIAYAAFAFPTTVVSGNPISINTGAIRISLQENWAQKAQFDLLNWIRGNSFTAVTALHVALYTDTPGVFGGGTEVTTQIRPAGRPSSPGLELEDQWNAPVAGSDGYEISNAGKIDFGASANTLANPITHVGIFDADSGGNLIFWGALAESLAVVSGDQVFFDPGQLVLRAT